jgi:RimJ/RimL family protein N-acetyltransferase
MYNNSSDALKENLHPKILIKYPHYLYYLLLPAIIKTPRKIKPYVVINGLEIVGFIYVSGSHHDFGFFVRESHQREGIGTFMVEEMKKRFDYLHGNIYSDNVASLKFHEKAGFNVYQITRILRWER